MDPQPRYARQHRPRRSGRLPHRADVAGDVSREQSEIFDVADREILVSIFADVLGRLAGDDWRLRDRVVSHMGVLAAARPPEDSRIVAVDYRDLNDLAESVAWAMRRAWSL